MKLDSVTIDALADPLTYGLWLPRLHHFFSELGFLYLYIYILAVYIYVTLALSPSLSLLFMHPWGSYPYVLHERMTYAT